MKCLKKHLLLLSALLLIVLGAVMPNLVSQMQDTQIRKFYKKLELNTVNLTLRQETDVGLVLQLLQQEYTEMIWEGETSLTAEDACHAALTAIKEMDSYGLFEDVALEQLDSGAGEAVPLLLVAEDGSSSVVWNCDYYSVSDRGETQIYLVTVDDTTGKLLRVLTSDSPTDTVFEVVEGWTRHFFNISPETDTGQAQDEIDLLKLEKWIVFLRNYYGIEPVDVTESAHGDIAYCFDMIFCSKDGSEYYSLKLDLFDGFMMLNYCSAYHYE